MRWVAGLSLGVALAAGCHKPQVRGESLTLERDAATADARETVYGPSRWSEAGGMCLDIPAGWTGRGVGRDGVLLTLVHRETGTAFELWAAGRREALPGFTRVFRDDAAYRSVPILFPAGTATWHSEERDGPTLQEWYGTVGGRSIRVEITTPHGRMIEGRQVAAPLLDALCHG